MNTLAHKV
jgi:hypothetical protein